MILEEAIKTTKFSSPVQKASLNILYTGWWLKTKISSELKSCGLTHEQFNVLRILKGKHPEIMCVKDIGSRMIEKNSNVPRIIDRLVSKALVSRTNSEVDKRETVIQLTSEGINVLVVANEHLQKLFQTAISIDEEKAVLLNDLLENFRVNGG